MWPECPGATETEVDSNIDCLIRGPQTPEGLVGRFGARISQRTEEEACTISHKVTSAVLN